MGALDSGNAPRSTSGGGALGGSQKSQPKDAFGRPIKSKGGGSTSDGAKDAFGRPIKPKGEGGSVSSLLSLLDTPAQVVRHGAKGVLELVTGDPGAAAGEYKEAFRRVAPIALPGSGPVADRYLSDPKYKKDLTFTETLEPTGVKKLPFGLETAGSILTDPLTYVTVGTGSTAKAGLKSVEAVTGAGGRKAVRQGGLKALSREEQEAVRSHILREATETVGEKKATKIADRQMTALEKHAKGGIGFHVPGTNIGRSFGGSGSFGESLAARSPKYRQARALFSEADMAEEARVARNLSRTGASDVDSLAQKATRLFDESELGGKVNTKIASLSAAPEQMPGTFHKLWRRAAVTYPGTVLNRLRQAAFYGLAEGMRPDQWTRYMSRGLKNYRAYNAVEKSLGLTDEFPEFVVALEKRIGKQGAREEIAFRQFADEPTYFRGIEQRAPKSKILKTVEKGRLIKHGGKKIREAGTAVEESSRRANFLFNLENRYGSFEAAGAHTKRVLPGVRAVSELERKLGEVLPFWTAMRADWQSVLRLMGDSPGRMYALTRLADEIGGTVELPGGLQLDLNQLKERHMPPLELAKALNIPLDLAKGELNSVLLALSDMSGGPLVTFVEQMAEAWLQSQRNPDMPKREMWYRFLKDYAPYLQRLPSEAEKQVAGKQLTSKNKSPFEALVKFATGVNVETEPGKPRAPQPKRTTGRGGGLGAR